MTSEPRVRPPLTIRITTYHDYTPDTSHYPDPRLETILKLDGDPEAIDEVMREAIDSGDVTRNIEVIHDGN